jgi:hypothetical protein
MEDLMINAIFDRIRRNPVITSQVIALAAAVVLDVVDVIQMQGGEWATIVGAVLAAAGYGRSQVTPVADPQPFRPLRGKRPARRHDA